MPVTAGSEAGRPAGADALPRRTLRRVTAVLALTEITSWGTLYYAFPVLAPLVARDTGWSLTQLTAAFSTGLLVSAFAGVPVGRVLDRVGPRPVMTTGSLVGAPALVAIGAAPSYPLLLLAWSVAGLAMAMLLYPPAFAALTRWGGERRTRAVTALTLVAGLASTVFAPVAHVLGQALGWRGAYAVLALVLLVLTLPAHAAGLRHGWTRVTGARGHDGPGAVPVDRRTFLALVLAMTAVSLCVYATVVNLVPLLVERGLSGAEAATALAVGGVGQLGGRLGYAALERSAGVVGRSTVTFAVVAVTTALLGLVPATAVALVTASLLVGVGRGAFTLVQATAVSDRWGVVGFGARNGLLTVPVLLATAAGPWVGSLLAELTGGPSGAFVTMAALAALAVALAPATRPAPRAG